MLKEMKKMEMNDQELKVTGTPVSYGDGATRNTKEGKGRFDLIPPEPYDLIATVMSGIGEVDDDPVYVYGYAMNDEIDKAIVGLVIFDFEKNGDFKPSTTVMMMHLMQTLARHFETGAKVYGERNCEKGIPEWSFRDSGLRHMSQYFNGENDEDHFAAALWNFWMLIWTRLKG